MTAPTNDAQTLVLERDIAQPPEKVWRALTEPHLIGEWLMQGDVKPEVGHAFEFKSSWGTIDCRVVEVDPPLTFVYTWSSLGLDSVVTWRLTPSSKGTMVRIEQVGFRPEQRGAYEGAKAGWPRFLDNLEKLGERDG